MKILTLNAHSWVEENQMEKLDQIVSKIIEEDYTIVALQEVNQLMAKPAVTNNLFCPPNEEEIRVPLKQNNFAKILVDRLKEKGHTYYFTWAASHVGYDTHDEGLAILAKEKFTAESKLVSDEDDYHHFTRRVVLTADVEIEGIPYSITNVHLSWWEMSGQHYFKNEWDQVADHIADKENVIVLGDFNSDALVSEEGYDYIQQVTPNLQDSFKVADDVYGNVTAEGEIDGWAGSKTGKRIDYIFTDQTIKPNSHKVVFDGKNGPVVSDHFGVEVEI